MKKLRSIALHSLPYLVLIVLALPVGLLSGMAFFDVIVITILLILQNASFTLVSRARQSSNFLLHAIAAIFSNGFFIFVITAFATHYNTVPLKFWYIVCTVVGSVHAHYISLHKIERSKAFKKDSLITRAEFEPVVTRIGRLEEAKAACQSQAAVSSPPVRKSRASYRPSGRGRRISLYTLRQSGQLDFGFSG
ncbi:MAG: hypothetical protein ACM3NH_02575 [Candidatus Saccharibacteria bacterium]